MHTATRLARASYTPGISGSTTRGPYEGSRKALKNAQAADRHSAAVARIECMSVAGRAAVIERADGAQAAGYWALAARLFTEAANSITPVAHGHFDVPVQMLDLRARVAASMAATGPARAQRQAQMAELLRAAA